MGAMEGDTEVTDSGGFVWDERRTKAAISLAHGNTVVKAAREAGVTRKTVHDWLNDPEFSTEVDRLTLLSDIANRAYRLRIAMRIIRKKEKVSEKDLLDWLKYAQSETDGAKLNLEAIFGNMAGAATGDGQAAIGAGHKTETGETNQ